MSAKPVILATVSSKTGLGGGVQAVLNMTQSLSGEFDFRLITQVDERTDPYLRTSLPASQWTELQHFHAYALSGLNWGELRRAVAAVPHDTLYLSSFFCRVLTLPLLLMRSVRLIPTRG